MAEASPTAAGEAVPTPFIRWEKVGQAGEERLWEQAHVWVDGSSAMVLGQRVNTSNQHLSLEVYELSEGKWVDDLMFERSKPAAAGEAPGPLARIGHTVVYSEAELTVYMFGGWVKPSATGHVRAELSNDVDVGRFDPQTKTVAWTRIPGKSAEELAAAVAAALAASAAAPPKKGAKAEAKAPAKDAKKDAAAKGGAKKGGKAAEDAPPPAEPPSVQEGGWPFARSGHAMTLLRRDEASGGLQMVVLGGLGPNGQAMGPSDGLWLFSPSSQSWTQVIDHAGQSPLPRVHHSLTAIGSEHLVVFGGSSPVSGGATNDLFLCHTDTWAWAKVEAAENVPRPLPRAWHTAVLVTGPRLLPPGRRASEASEAEAAHHEAGSKHPHATSSSSPLKASLNTSLRTSLRSQQAAAALPAGPRWWTSEEGLLVFGGAGKEGPVEEAEAWVLGPNGRWQSVESRGCPPSGRYAHATATFDQGNSRMLVFGGADGKGGRMADWYTVDLLARDPEPLPPPPPPDPRYMRKHYDNGDVYEGDNEDGTREGRGTCTYADGSVYEGEWRADKPCGHGSLRMANGDVYTGAFEAGRFHGVGNYAWARAAGASPQDQPLEESFHGDWDSGRRSGVGRVSYTDGSFYAGGWEDDVPHGKGEAGYGETRVSGTWEKGVLVKGKEADGAKGEEYEGEFQGRLRHGYGTVVYRDGSQYEGFWRLGKRNGIGRFYNAVTLERHEGKWVADQRNGRGRSTYACGNRFEGVWEKGLRTGPGVLKLANGDVFTGSFLHDKRHGPGQLKKKNAATAVAGMWEDDVQVS